MLQQTPVARVMPRYGAFLTEFPTLHHVARASTARVCEAWAGLGYYARARNLHALAVTVTGGGREAGATLPTADAALRALPGVGAYTAGAVRSFAFEQRAELVDTNVARVLRRLFDPRIDPRTRAGQAELWRLARAILPRTGRAAWSHNQALMELGALVCTARIAHCDRCPVRRECATASVHPRRPARTTAGVRRTPRAVR